MRRVLVTGASKGIGQAIALQLARDGFLVTVHYHQDQLGAQSTLQQITAAGGHGLLLQFDVSDMAQTRVVLEQDMAQNGAYYGIVNNAGISRDNAFPLQSEEDWLAVMRTNLDSFYAVIQPCVMPMIGLRQGGRIITLSSVSGLIGNRGQVNYSAAKAGIIGASKALALELAKRKITVNCIAPGLIDTPMLDLDEQTKAQILEQIPLRRIGQATEVASLASYLMSDNAAYITRQVIAINGGLC